MRASIHRTLGAAILAAALVAGCSTGSEDSGEATVTTAAQDAGLFDVAKFGTVPLEDAGAEFARGMRAAVMEGDVEAYNGLFDWDALLEMTTTGVDVTDAFRGGFIKGAKGSIAKEGLGPQLTQNVASGGSYDLVRVHEVDGEMRALFRMTHPESGLNYHDVVLIQRPNGVVRAVDIYVFLSGEKLSKSLRRMYLLGAAGESRSFVDRLVGVENAFVKHGDQINDMGRQIRAGNYQQALDIYDGLPPSLRREKTVMLLRIQAAMEIGDDVYAKVIADFRKAHPRDPCLDIIAIDGYVIGGQHAEALQCIDRLDEALGGDPYLNVMRANVHLESGETAEARRFAAQAVDELPGIIDGYWMIVSVSLAQEDYAATADGLNRIAKQFGIEFGDLTTIPEYAGFAKSPEYQQWRNETSKVPGQR